MAFGTKDEEKPGSGSTKLERVLWHPLRARMFEELQKRAIDTPELAATFGKPLAWVRYHYRVLEAAGGLPNSDRPGHS